LEEFKLMLRWMRVGFGYGALFFGLSLATSLLLPG